MKILHVSYIYPPQIQVADGITTVVCNTTSELVKKGHSVTVVTSDLLDLNSNKLITSGLHCVNGVKVIHLKSWLRLKTFIVTPTLVFVLARNIKKFDVIHIHDCRSFQGLVTYIMAKLTRIPYVFQPHGSVFSSTNIPIAMRVGKFALDSSFTFKLINDASKIIVLSQTEASQYVHMGIHSKKIVIVPNAIANSNYFPKKGDFKRKYSMENEKIILYLGRVHESKGIALIIEAFNCLIKDNDVHGLKLVIAGPDDGYLSKAKTLVSSLGLLSFVVFTGFIDGNTKLDALADAEVLVTPEFHGLPMTFLESCSVGTPIISTTAADCLDWLNGNVGIVTKPIDKDLARTLFAVIFDRTLHEKLSANCVSTVQSFFSIDRVITSLENVYVSCEKIADE